MGRRRQVLGAGPPGMPVARASVPSSCEVGEGGNRKWRGTGPGRDPPPERAGLGLPRYTPARAFCAPWISAFTLSSSARAASALALASM